MKVLAGQVLSERWEGSMCPGPSPWLVESHLHVHTVFSLYACLCLNFPSHKDTNPGGLGLTLNLITSIRTLSPNKLTF